MIESSSVLERSSSLAGLVALIEVVSYPFAARLNCYRSTIAIRYNPTFQLEGGLGGVTRVLNGVQKHGPDPVLLLVLVIVIVDLARLRVDRVRDRKIGKSRGTITSRPAAACLPT